MEEFCSIKLKEAGKNVEDGIEETLIYCDFPSEHWTRIRTNNVIERLVKNGAGFCWKGVVHEAIAPMRTILYSYVAIENRKLKQGDPDRNLRIYEKQLASGTKIGPRESFFHARELFYHGRYKEAIDELTHFLTLPDSWLETRLDACRMIAACYDMTDRPDAALKALLGNLSEDEARAEICCDIGRHFMEKKK